MQLKSKSLLVTNRTQVKVCGWTADSNKYFKHPINQCSCSLYYCYYKMDASGTDATGLPTYLNHMQSSFPQHFFEIFPTCLNATISDINRNRWGVNRILSCGEKHLCLLCTTCCLSPYIIMSSGLNTNITIYLHVNVQLPSGGIN